VYPAAIALYAFADDDLVVNTTSAAARRSASMAFRALSDLLCVDAAGHSTGRRGKGA
jgi:hypothetical protein